MLTIGSSDIRHTPEPGYSMIVRCPSCRSEQPLFAADGGARGSLVRCSQCGTRWLARPYEGLLPLAEDRVAVSDAVIVEDVTPRPRRQPPASVRGLPPRRRAPVDGRLKGFGIALSVLAALVVLWTPIVAALPELKRLPAEAGSLDFRKVRSETVSLRGVRTLFVEGEIVNRAAGSVDLPAIRITLKSSDGTPVSSWLVELAADGLAAGRSIAFRSALVSPPADAAEVTLDLAERQGLGGLR
jgi:predicted Zn finger-like uncharacterized protein